jgi:hypothetical protein
VPATPPEPRPLRLATWNVEWMNALFDEAGRLLADEAPSARHGVSRGEQLAGIGIVLTALDADGVMIVEAPDTSGERSTVRALERLAREIGLRTSRAVIGFANGTEQEIAFLFDPDVLAVRHDPWGPPGRHRLEEAPRFDGTLDRGRGEEPLRLSKPPLELAVEPARGAPFRLVGVHAKSKAPHGARDAREARRLAVENRRKQLAECGWIRARVERLLDAGEPFLVMGDLNDGPGLDDYERLFGRSGVEIVLGSDAPAARRLTDPHAQMAVRRRTGLVPTTARFYLKPEARYFEALLDFVMVSPDLAARAPRWRIWHPFNDPAIATVPALRDALLSASDHFPVTIDLPAN